MWAPEVKLTVFEIVRASSEVAIKIVSLVVAAHLSSHLIYTKTLT